MKTINYIIIDDEPLARDIIRTFADKISWLKLKGQFANASSAYSMMLSPDTHLAFVDINMPQISGIDLIKSLKNPPQFIFTTAYREYAVTAFEINAVDYLVKPFAFDRFLQAINKAANILNLANKENQPQEKDFIIVKSDNRHIKININSIIYIEAYREYVKIHTTDSIVLSLLSMKTILEMLPKVQFFRIHRSYIISLKHLDYVQGFEVFVNNTKLPISREIKDDFLLFLQNK